MKSLITTKLDKRRKRQKGGGRLTKIVEHEAILEAWVQDQRLNPNTLVNLIDGHKLNSQLTVVKTNAAL